ncbi:MAG TPA: hypothetical protein VNJ04_11990 [Gemmatimonadaceae bacterium]|nr:hypothetical protein [Gemmatimonadaceae bacterium]
MSSTPEHCPLCHGDQCLVINSRPHPTKRIRRRQCLRCGQRWNTYESLIDPDEIPPAMLSRLTPHRDYH